MENVPNHQPASMVLVKGPSPPSVPSRPVAPPLPRLQLQGPLARPLEFHRAHHAQVEANLSMDWFKGKSSPETQGLTIIFLETQGFDHHFCWGCSCKFETIIR